MSRYEDRLESARRRVQSKGGGGFESADGFVALPVDAVDLTKAQAKLDAASRTAGLVYEYRRLAVAVGPDCLLTNRHVAALFADGVGLHVTTFSGLGPSVAFRYEYAAGELGAPPDLAGPRFDVKAVEWVHPYWDAALLRVEGDG